MKKLALVLILALIAGGSFTGAQAIQPTATTSTPTIGILPVIDRTGGLTRDAGGGMAQALEAEMRRVTPTVTGRVLTIDPSTRVENLDAAKALEIGRAASVDLVLITTLVEATTQEWTSGAGLPCRPDASASVDPAFVRAIARVDSQVLRVGTGETLLVNKAHKTVNAMAAPGSPRTFAGFVCPPLSVWNGSNNDFVLLPLGHALQIMISAVVRDIETIKLGYAAGSRAR